MCDLFLQSKTTVSDWKFMDLNMKNTNKDLHIKADVLFMVEKLDNHRGSILMDALSGLTII